MAIAKDPPMSLELTEDGADVRMRLKVRAGGKRNRIAGVLDGALKVEVPTAPERGKANKAVLALLAKTLGIAPGAIVLTAGLRDPRKTVRIHGLTADAIRARLSPPNDATPP